MRYLIVRCHYQLVNRTSKYFLPHIVKGEEDKLYRTLAQNLDTNSKTGYQKSIVEDLE
jgi:hypothetical protein